MKVLFLVQADQRAIHDRLYDGIMDFCECDIRWLDDGQQNNLRRYFRERVDVSQYDRILLFLRSKKEFRQACFIRSIPGLVILEHDACQNYISGKYSGKFSRHYRKIPWARVVCSGYSVSEQLRQEGVDARFVPKYYDSTLLKDFGRDRDIELGFVGSVKSGVYSQRRELLEGLAECESLVVARTASGAEYCEILNRIRFFVSADVGLGEYMAKNFEAMACGCVLFAYDQGESENKGLGFQDMQNVVLYKSLDDLRKKLNIIRADDALADSIRMKGRELVEREYAHVQIGRKVVDSMRDPLRPRPVEGMRERLRSMLCLFDGFL